MELTQPNEADLGRYGLLGNTDNIWLPTTVATTFSEELPQECTRYVKEGSGTVAVGSEVMPVAAGTLVKVVDGPADITWTSNGDDDLVLLIAEYWSTPRVLARKYAPVVVPFFLLTFAVPVFQAINTQQTG